MSDNPKINPSEKLLTDGFKRSPDIQYVSMPLFELIDLCKDAYIVGSRIDDDTFDMWLFKSRDRFKVGGNF